MVDLQMDKVRIVDFKNTLIIMTSNIGSHLILEDPALSENTRERVADELKARLNLNFKQNR